MSRRRLLGACLGLMVSFLVPESSASTAGPPGSSGEVTGPPPSTVRPGCQVPLRRPARYEDDWRFLPTRSGVVRGTFGRLSWDGQVLTYRIDAGSAVDYCVGTRGGGVEFTQSGTEVGPATGRVDLGDPVDMVGFGVLGSVPSSIGSGLQPRSRAAGLPAADGRQRQQQRRCGSRRHVRC